MEALLIIMVFARPAITASTFVMVFIGSVLEVGGGIVAQAPPTVFPGVSPATGLVMAYTGLITAVGGLILGILQILAANRKADALTMVQLATMQAQNEAMRAENDRLRKEVAENKGWIVTLLNRRHGEEIGPDPTYHVDPATATPQAIKASQKITELLQPAPTPPPLPLPVPPALMPMIATANPYGPLPAGKNGERVLDARVEAINRNTEAAQDQTKATVDLKGAVEDVSRKLD